uniref:Serine/threonine-protein kinase n=1 Tax=Cyclopterus lumpus TaxID=8103 RepID=A0A8C2XNE1_CYCLU
KEQKMGKSYKGRKKLGEGGYGCVYAGYRREDNLPVAIKHIMIDEELLFHEDSDGLQIPMEVAVLRKLEAQSEQHSASIDLLDWYVVDQELILVLERPMPAVDLFDYIQDKGGYLKEKEAKIIMKQLVDAAIDLQEKHIFHRDIKTENLLIETGMKLPRVRVIDFGLSCFSEEDDVYSTFYGKKSSFTPFAAPELIRGTPVSVATDVWSVGVLAYVALSGVSPFLDESPEETCVNICRLDFCFPDEYFRDVSQAARDFVSSALQQDPRKRPSATSCLQHPWVGRGDVKQGPISSLEPP